MNNIDRTSKQCAIWHRANAIEVPDVPEMLDHPGDTVSCFLAISDGFRVGRARWHYPTKSWCHKGNYDGNVLFWSLVPNWDRTSDETSRCRCGSPLETVQICRHCGFDGVPAVEPSEQPPVETGLRTGELAQLRRIDAAARFYVDSVKPGTGLAWENLMNALFDGRPEKAK